MEVQKLMEFNAAFIISAKQLHDFADYVLNEQAKKYLQVIEQANASRVLSTREVMGMLGTSQKTLWEWARRDYLVPVKIGRFNFYKMGDIIDIIREQNDMK